ncbi:LysR family transcriptional regulator [Streptomyces sp. NPDC018026]|uniref:LysR family transcriptional regulator n=1 Tax=Streptomyces sp. NPDC018026 TaxID=3365031 RepID=UPI0037B9E63A
MEFVEAAGLAIAQPALSKAVRRLESRLGVRLLERSSRHVALTTAGEALLHHGRHALDAVGAAAEETRRAGDRHAHLRLVIKPGGDGNLLSGILAGYAGRPDARQVDILFGGATDRADHVRDGRAHVALVYAPFDDMTGLDHETLAVEGRVAILSPDHGLAARPEVTLADLARETLPRWKGVRWTGAPEAGPGPEVTDAAEALRTRHRVVPGRPSPPDADGLPALPVVAAAQTEDHGRRSRPDPTSGNSEKLEQGLSVPAESR